MDQDFIKILVVDDEEDLCEILQFNLESQGYHVSVAYSAEEALKYKIEDFHLILLDVMMEGMSGYRFAEKVRKELELSIPIIFLTARGSENDLLTGFNLGGDDYITKPFSINEVTARVKAVIRRSGENTSDTNLTIDHGDIRLNLEQKSVSIKGKSINLARKEFEIFSLLFRTPNRIFTRQEILLRVWPEEVIVNDRTVDVNVTRLRKKLDTAGRQIRNKPGYGYYFQTEDE